MRPIEQNEFYKYSYLGGLGFAPDGKKAALVVTNINSDKNSYDSNLWLYRDEKFTKLTSANAERTYFWDGNDEILFFAMRDDADKKRAEGGEQFTCVYRININGGEAVKAFELPFYASYLERKDEKSYVVQGSFNKECPDYYKLDKEGRDAENKRIADDKDYEVCDETPFWFNGAGFVNGSVNGIFLYNTETGAVERITAADFDAEYYVLLDNKLYFCGNAKTHKRDYKSSIMCYDFATGKTETVLDAIYSVQGLEKVGGKLVALLTDCKEYGLNQSGSVYEIDTKTYELKALTGPLGIGNSTGSDCRKGSARTVKSVGDKLYFIATVRNSAVLRCMNIDGSISDVYVTEDSVDDFDVSETDGRILITLLKSDALQDVYDINGNRLSSFNAEVLKDIYVAEPKKLTISSCDTDIDGWVMLPYGYEPGKKYPAVLDIHGGPKTVYGQIFYHEMQYWAGNGYFVFFCNPIGGDGRGDEFADIRGKYGTVDYQNIMDFTDAVLAAYPDIDTNRVCVTGGSYGGFMTNWIIGHTNRFCCAATQRSISNWVSFNGVSDIGEWFGTDQQAANMYDNIEKLWWHSPLKYAGNVVTPTLFIHSDQDYRCPLEQGIQLYTALQNRDIESRMCIFHGENHELSRGGAPLHRSRRLQEITDWFEKFT